MSKKREPIPELGYPLIETHCHLDYLEAEPLADILERAQAKGVERLVTIAVSPDNLDRAAELAESHAAVWFTQGVHPHDAQHYNAQARSRILGRLGHPRLVAIGEIGLDYHYDNSPREAQRQAFAEQLAIAADNDLPVVIHSRDADEDMADMLREHAPALRRRGVIHSFTSSPELADCALELGFCLGFNGIVTFNRADNVRAVASRTPLDRVLLETDAPYLTPVPYRGTPNAPYYLPFVARRMAEVCGVDTGELLRAAHANSMALFWPEEAPQGASVQ